MDTNKNLEEEKCKISESNRQIGISSFQIYKNL